MAIVRIGDVDGILDDIICSGRTLPSILKEIEDQLSDAFKDISINRQRESPWIDIREDIEGYLCKIQELLELIK